MRHLTLATLAAFATLTAGCGVFYDQQETGGVTETLFDETLPESLVEVFEECSDPLSIEPGDSEIDLRGGCGLTDVSTVGAQTILLGLAASPIEIEPIPETLYSGSTSLIDFPWPMQNCEVDLSYEVRLDELKLYDLDSGWREFRGAPSLWIDFDFESWADVLEFRIDYEVDCPKRINERALNGLFGIAIPNGWRQLSVRGLDLDLWVSFADAGDELSADLYLDIDLSEIDTDTYLSNLPGNVDQAILDALGFDLVSIEDEIEAQLYDAFSDLPGEVASAINGELPEGHTVCSVGLDGGLEVITDEPGMLSCVRRVRAKRF